MSKTRRNLSAILIATAIFCSPSYSAITQVSGDSTARQEGKSLISIMNECLSTNGGTSLDLTGRSQVALNQQCASRCQAQYNSCLSRARSSSDKKACEAPMRACVHSCPN